MSMSVSTLGEDMIQSSSTFSYAQAAKRQVVLSATSPAGKHDSFNWADDAADAVTVTEDAHSSTKSHTSSSKTSESERSLPRLPTMDDNAESVHSGSSDFVMVSSNPTTKEGELIVEPKSPPDNTWENKSQSSSVVSPARGPGEEWSQTKSKANKEKNTEGVVEGAGEKPLREAPIPAVNFWQQRAQYAKAKHGSTTSQIKSTSSIVATQSQQGVNNGTAALPKVASKPLERKDPDKLPANSVTSRRENIDRSEDNDIRLAGPTTLHGGKSARPQKSELTVIESNPPPPVRDVVSWPTPLSAQDENRRKAQEKGDKVDKERTTTSGSKIHGKSEWKPVPYTPSVKFNTPMPTSRGRGGRPNIRGGRGGAHNDRGSAHSNDVSAEDAPSEVRTREGNGSVLTRTASELSTTPRPRNSVKDVSNEPTASEIRTARDISHKNANTDIVVPITELLNLPNMDESIPQAVHEQGLVASGDKPQMAETKQKFDNVSTDNYAIRRRSTAHNDVGLEGVAPPRQKRRPSQTAAREAFNGESRDRTRPALENGASAERGSWGEGKNDANNQNRERDPSKETWNSAPHRGEGRAERGRGWKSGRGSHAQASHYSSGQSHNGSHLPLILTGINHQPTKASASYSQHYNQSGNFPSTSRGGYRNGSRSATISGDASFGRFTPTYSNGYQYPYQPYTNGLYDYSNIAPVNANQYSPYVDTVLFNEIGAQLTYYFSLENMIKDLFLRKYMDSQGFVSLSLIASFKRMKDLTTDLELIKYVCLQSEEYELSIGLDGKERIRRKGDWAKWVLPVEDRDATAKNEGPAEIGGVFTVYSSIFGTPAQLHHMNSTPGFSTQGREPFSQSFSGAASSFSPVPMNPSANGFHSPSLISTENQTDGFDNEVNGSRPATLIGPESGTLQLEIEQHDSHTDDQTQFLKVVVRPLNGYSSDVATPSEQIPQGNAGETNGIFENQQSDERHSRSVARQDEYIVGERAQCLASLIKKSISPSFLDSMSAVKSAGFFWIKENEMEKLSPLPDKAECVPYDELKKKAFQQREAAVQGHTPYDMFVLYNFWSHFLIRNFNTSMYLEFYELAHQDASNNSTKVGLDRLIDFYVKVLSSQQVMRDIVARHYISLVHRERSEKNRPAFEALRSAWRNGATNLKNRKKMSDFVDAELREELDR